MKYGICHLSIIPLRGNPSDSAEMVSQVLLGEHFKVIEARTKWSKVRLAFDGYVGWVDNKQFIEIQNDLYQHIEEQKLILAKDLATDSLNN